MEVLPGLEASPWDAVRWAIGMQELPGLGKWSDGESAIRLFDYHQQDVDVLRQRMTREPPADDLSIRVLRESIRKDELRLLRLRWEMRRAGLVPPALPPELAYLNQDASGRFIDPSLDEAPE